MVVRTRASRLRFLAMLLAATAVAGCDKCGEPMKFNAPSIPKVCGDKAATAK